MSIREPWASSQANYREQVRQYYATHLGCTQQECADALSISRKTVYRHLTAMRAEWVMQGERDAA